MFTRKADHLKNPHPLMIPEELSERKVIRTSGVIIIKEDQRISKQRNEAAALRGKQALAKHRQELKLKAVCEVERQLDLKKRQDRRKAALEIEKKRSAKIISLPLPANTCIKGQCPAPTEEDVCKPEITRHVGNELECPQEMNAWEKARQIIKLEEEENLRQALLKEKRNIEAKRRFQVALKEHRKQKACDAILNKLQKAQKDEIHENAKRVSQMHSDTIMMRAPAAELVKLNKQQYLMDQFKKMQFKKMLKPKVALEPEDFNDNKDQVLKRKTSTSHIPSTFVSPPAIILNTTYPETLSCGQPPISMLSPSSSIKPTKKDFGMQIQDDMFPVSRGTQVDLLTYEDSIERCSSEPVIRKNDKCKRVISSGNQTDHTTIVVPSKFFISPSSTSKHDVPMFPNLLISQNEAERVRKMPISRIDDPKRHTASNASMEIQPENQNLRHLVIRALENIHFKQKQRYQSVPLSMNFTPESSDRLLRLQNNENFVPMREHAVQTMPLAEPIRDQFTSSIDSPRRKYHGRV